MSGTHRVTDAEFAILEILWDLGPLTARRITEQLYPGGRSSDSATVQKLLHRLGAKGFIHRDRRSFAHIIHATGTRTEFVGAQLRAVADKISGGSLVPLLVQLVEDHYLKAEERTKLRQLLEEHD